jgi:hypothetical protein
MLACALLAGAIIAGCAAKPVLLPKGSAAPSGVDLSGYWVLQEPAGKKREPAGALEPRIRIPGDSPLRGPQPERSSRRSSGPSAQLFTENGSALKITQTSHGLFISFDRSVVEEFTFGENRIIAIGPVEAQRVSGWEGESFVVQTLDEQGYVLTEVWRLAEDGNVLVRDVSMVRKDKQSSFSRQRFSRSQS